MSNPTPVFDVTKFYHFHVLNVSVDVKVILQD